MEIIYVILFVISLFLLGSYAATVSTVKDCYPYYKKTYNALVKGEYVFDY
jgi:hypothetical protein